MKKIYLTYPTELVSSRDDNSFSHLMILTWLAKYVSSKIFWYRCVSGITVSVKKS